MATTIVTPVAPAPMDFLQRLSQWFKLKFNPVAKVVVTDATEVAEVAQPFIDVALPGFAGLYNSTLQTVTALESAAGSVSGTGAQKMTSAVQQLSPIAIPYLQSIGVSNANLTTMQAYIQSVVDGMKIFQALPTPIAAIPTPISPTPVPPAA